jgi:hypothetical protein
VVHLLEKLLIILLKSQGASAPGIIYKNSGTFAGKITDNFTEKLRR